MSGRTTARPLNGEVASPCKALFAGCSPEPELARALDARGVEVAAVARAGEAAARARDFRPACLLLDLDGDGAADVAGGFSPAPGRAERVVLLASAGTVFSAMKCLAARRADHVLMKPVSADEVAAIVAAPRAAAGAPRLPSLERIQWEYIQAVLGSCDGNVSEAARQLGIYRQSLQRMLRRHPPSR